MSVSKRKTSKPAMDFNFTEPSTNELFLRACDAGNIDELKKLMSLDTPPDLDCRDSSGRTALFIALEKDDVDLMEYLIPFAEHEEACKMLLDSIGEKKEDIACAILRNMNVEDENKQVLDNQLDQSSDADVTPLMAAAMRNLYEVVRSLHSRGDVIERPHHYRCGCEECVTQTTVDQLRFARRRLNAYKAITSESYLSIASPDAIKDAFKLSGEMRELAMEEKHFRGEYITLAEQVSEYLVKLLDRVNEQTELEAILNHVDNRDPNVVDIEEPLYRIKLAIDYEEKKFVAHPSCQMKIVNLWYEGASFLQRGSTLVRTLYFISLILVHPILLPILIFFPNLKLLSFLKAPVVKFCIQMVWYFIFLAIIISWSFNSSSAVPWMLDLDDYPDLHYMFKESTEGINYIMIRKNSMTAEEYLILLWTIGNLMGELDQLKTTGIREHFKNLYNVIDHVTISMYFASLSLRAAIVSKVNISTDYFSNSENLDFLRNETAAARLQYYWLNPDRYLWDSLDPHHVAEGIFAIANVLSFSRISYILPVNELLGPLQISLGRMLFDVLRFTVIFSIVLFSFMIGLDNLFWYYNDDNRWLIEHVDHDATEAGTSYGTLGAALASVFWGLFGMSDQNSVKMKPYDAGLTESIAGFLFGAYMVASVIVLLNMLIAMMSSSFEQIREDSDVEWKFARSKLYLEFIMESGIFPPPLNLIELITVPIKSIVHNIRNCKIRRCFVRKRKIPKNLPSIIERQAEIRKMAAFRHDQENAPETINMTQLQQRTVDGVKNPSYRDENKNKELISVKKTSYNEIIAGIVERFIFDVTNGDEGETEDELGDLRKDISRLRRDVFNSMSTQERELQSMRSDITKLTMALTSQVVDCISQVDDCKDGIAELDRALRSFHTELGESVVSLSDGHKRSLDELRSSQEEGLHMYLAITERVYTALNSISNHVMKVSVAPSSSLTDILTFKSNKPKM